MEVVEVPVAMMNGTAAAMRSSRLRGRLRMAGAWTIEDFLGDELNFLRALWGGLKILW